MSTAYWLVAAASLIATWLNIHRRRACFAIWAVTNAAWTWADYRAALYPQAALQLVYFGLALYGFAHWRTPEARTNPAPREAPS